MNRKITKSLCLSMAMILLITFIPLMKPIQANAADYSAWSSIFDPTYYAEHYADANAYANGNVDLLWQHFVYVGIPNGRQASAEFNVSIYIQNYPDLQKVFGTNLIQYYVHYAQSGKLEGRVANYLISTSTPAKQTVPATTKNTTTATTNTSNTPKNTTSKTTTSRYESIYNTYAAKINSYSGKNINDIANYYSEGVSKMADYWASTGGSYSTYESWATKLYSVYEKKGMSMYGF